MKPRLPMIAATLGLLAAPAWSEGDPAEGEKVFRKCKACHEVGEDAKNKVGPILNNVLGQPAAQNPDFKYSSAMTEAAANGLVWDEESLTAYLEKPKEFMPGTKMSFAGLRKPEDIADVIAYLMPFSPMMEDEPEEEAETETSG